MAAQDGGPGTEGAGMTYQGATWSEESFLVGLYGSDEELTRFDAAVAAEDWATMGLIGDAIRARVKGN